MKTEILFAILLALCTSVFARVGETEQQIEERYGRPTATVRKEGDLICKAYTTGGMEIVAAYLNGVCQQEIIFKEDKTALSDEQIKMLLEANGGGKKWEIVNLPGSPKWKTADDQMRAILIERHLTIMTTQFFNATLQQSRKKEAEQLKNF